MMRRLILKMSVSLDGFVGGPSGETDWMPRGQDEAGKRWVEETLRRAGLHVIGRKTFQAWGAYWPRSSDRLAAPMNDIPKAVFTRQGSLDCRAYPGNWATAEIVTGDLASEIARLKQQEGEDMLAQGGAGFARSLAASGLVDEYRLVVHPVALGTGLSLFAGLPRRLDLQLCDSTRFPSGTVAQVYQPA